MIRVVQFEGEKAQERFDKVWEGFVFGSRAEQNRRQGTGQPPDVSKQRLRGKVTRKLKAVSVESKRVIAGQIFHRDLAASPTIEFDQPELELVIKTLEEAEWNPEHLDDAFDVVDWLSASEKREV